MADINKRFILEDGFSGTFNRYVRGLEESMDKTDRMSEATQDLVNRFGHLQQAAQSAGSDREMERYLERLVAAMARAGLEWTTEAGRMQAEDMLMHESLQQLAERGEIAASKIAELKYAAQTAAKGTNELTESTKKLSREMSGTSTRGIGRILVSLFSLRRILTAMRNAIRNAPNSVAGPWNRLVNKLKSTVGGFFYTLLKNMGDGLERINAALNSDAGKKFMSGLAKAATALGQAIGWLLGLIADLVEWIGDHMEAAAIAAAIAMGVLVAKTLAQAAASVIANWKIILLVGALAALSAGFGDAAKDGNGLENVLYHVGAAFGWMGAVVYNLISDVWNVLALFAEFIGNLFYNPLGAVFRLFVDVFDAILGIIETVADALSALFGSEAMHVALSMANAPTALINALPGSIDVGSIKGFRADVQKWADDTWEKPFKVDRLEKVDTAEWMAGAGNKLREIGSSVTDLEKYAADTAGSASSIDKHLSDQDLTDIIEAAERHFIAQVNLTAQSPVITVNGANTGNTEADRRALADAISQMLVEQAAYGTIRSSAAMGG